MSVLTYEELGFIIDQLKAAMKCLDVIEWDNPVDDHIKAGYTELDRAVTVAERLQKTAQYETED